jgi:hypothetical protein
MSDNETGNIIKKCKAFRVSNGKQDNVAFRGFPNGPYNPGDYVTMTLYANGEQVYVGAGDIVIRKC